ncbi:MAG: signal peptidase I [Patescibacteria group bacterium]
MKDIIEKPRPENTEAAQHIQHPIAEHPLGQFLRFIYEIGKTVVVVLVIYTLVHYLLIQPFQVEGSSMERNFHNDEFLMVQKISYAIKAPERGDVIVFKYPLNPSLNYIKRVIGLPGDKLTISDGKVIITNTDNPKGLVLNEGYLDAGKVTSVNGDTAERSWLIENNQYFVMGDNRDHSDDSRSWGTVPKQNLVGKVWVTVYPFSDFGLIAHATY